jgi:hypothetical protein
MLRLLNHSTANPAMKPRCRLLAQLRRVVDWKR